MSRADLIDVIYLACDVTYGEPPAVILCQFSDAELRDMIEDLKLMELF
jgi:hypothetical protein